MVDCFSIERQQLKPHRIVGRLILAALTILVLGFGIYKQAYGQDELLTAEVDQDYSFGQVMRFYLKAIPESPVEAITLFIRIGGEPAVLTAEVATVNEAELDIMREINLTQTRVAPFSEITYWWQIETKEGFFRETEPVSFEYIDDRFEWNEIDRNGIFVHWASDDLTLGQVTLDIASEALVQVRDVVRASLSTPIRIYVYPTSDDIRSALRLTGRDWLEAHARPELGVIMLPANNAITAPAQLSRTLPHELSHLLLFQSTGLAYSNVPRWFDEGLATTFEDIPNADYEVILDEAIAGGEIISFQSLCLAFPSDSTSLSLAYAQSASLIRYIRSTFGDRKLAEMIDSFSDGADCNSLTIRSLDRTLDELTDDWLNRQGGASRLTRLWQNGSGIIVFIAGFSLFTFIFIVRAGSLSANRAKNQT